MTRCWSKEQRNFLRKLPKKYPHQFNVKSAILHNIPTLLLNIWATFARNFVPLNFKNRPIWSHWQCPNAPLQIESGLSEPFARRKIFGPFGALNFWLFSSLKSFFSSFKHLCKDQKS